MAMRLKATKNQESRGEIEYMECGREGGVAKN